MLDVPVSSERLITCPSKQQVHPGHQSADLAKDFGRTGRQHALNQPQANAQQASDSVVTVLF